MHRGMTRKGDTVTQGPETDGYTHDGWCDRGVHTDLALPCASPPVRLHGTTTWIHRTQSGTVEAHLEGVTDLGTTALDDVICCLQGMRQIVSRPGHLRPPGQPRRCR